MRLIVLLFILGAAFADPVVCAAQDYLYRENYRGRYGNLRVRPVDTYIKPMWEANKEYPHDVFTFARLKYTSARDVWGQPQWSVDFPDSDMNFSYRLKEVTSLEVNPVPVIVDLASEDIFRYPFLYLIEPGQIELTNTEIENLRKYIARGGFVMVDDFWGQREWDAFASEMKRVFPDREIVDIPLEHPVFNIVYQIREKPMIPSIGYFNRGYNSDRGEATHANYCGILDDQGRVQIMICHNTDLGDGWEREGESNEYFERYSVKFAYPLGINIVVYAMTQ